MPFGRLLDGLTSVFAGLRMWVTNPVEGALAFFKQKLIEKRDGWLAFIDKNSEVCGYVQDADFSLSSYIAPPLVR